MKTILYMACSIDGKTTLGEDNTDWVEAADIARMDALMQDCGVMIMGSKTYASFGDELPSEDALQIVLTSNPELLNKKQENVRFTNVPLKTLRDGLSEEGFEKVLIAGGSELNTSLIQEDLIDEIRLIIKPIVISEGKSLFKRINGIKQFELVSIEKLDYGSVEVVFKRQEI